MRFDIRSVTIACLLIVGIVLAWATYRNRSESLIDRPKEAVTPLAVGRASPRPSPIGGDSSGTKRGPPAPRGFSLAAADLPPGTELKRDADGRIATLRGSIPLGGAEADGTIDRARRVLDEVVRLSGRSDLAFGDPRSNATVDADQIFFPQVAGTVPLFPPRGLNVLVGSGGTLEALDADFSDPVEVRGAVPAPPPPGSVTVVYVERKDDRTVGHYAYRSENMGEETIRDAATGKILFHRTRRQF